MLFIYYIQADIYKKKQLRKLLKNSYDANFPYTRLFWARLKLYADYGYAIKCYANSVYAFAEHDHER